jgi:LysR family transcriptional activator of nhaA
MEWLNYQHLYYFWTVVREGTVTEAARRLRLAQPTISAQIRQLQEYIGRPLFERQGRRLVLTEVGRTVHRYADEIFSLGNELQDLLRGDIRGSTLHFSVGIADVLPKLVAYRLLEPALSLEDPVRISCSEGKANELLSRLSIHELDLVLTDAPIGPEVHIRAFNHLLGSCGVSVFAAPKLARRMRRKFPRSLDGAPMLLPVEHTTLRRSLDRWFDSHNLRPEVVGEFADSALMKVFGQGGHGLLVGPSVIEREIRRQYGLDVVGRTAEVTERFYAISVERRVKHPAVMAIAESARSELFRSAEVAT